MEEDEESLFKADAVSEQNPERDREEGGGGGGGGGREGGRRGGGGGGATLCRTSMATAVSKEAKREAAVLLRQASHVWRITRGRV